jgi:acetylornithine/succinyldiaminopimelate/putrescine aminotransferase
MAGIGVAALGHSNREVLAALERQARRHLHVMVYGEYVQEAQARLARRLASVLPGGLSVTYFTSSGAEAVEGSLKLARKWTGRSRFVAFEGGYHGDTMGALSLMSAPTYRRPFEPLLPDVEFLPWNDEASLLAIDDRVAAVIVEPIQSEGGVRAPGPSFLPEIRRRCDEAGALFILDEVLTGFGRTGRVFACEHWNTSPDVLVMAKALGGGLPLGGFAARPEVMATLSKDPPLAHVTTFGGHPLSCAAGLAALEVLLREDLAGRALRLGEDWRLKLRKVLPPKALADIRGLGLLIGLEFRDPERVRAFVGSCRDNGLLVGWTLHSDTVVRMAPPLTIRDDELDNATGIMGRVAARIWS